jgi:predicted nucleic acid-binding Zn ribbon protein
MRRKKTQKLGEVIKEYLKEANIEKKLKEVELIRSWEEIVGKPVANRTEKISIKEGKLYVCLKSSVVRNELFMMREKLLGELNKRAGENLIKEIVLK